MGKNLALKHSSLNVHACDMSEADTDTDPGQAKRGGTARKLGFKYNFKGMEKTTDFCKQLHRKT